MKQGICWNSASGIEQMQFRSYQRIIISVRKAVETDNFKVRVLINTGMNDTVGEVLACNKFPSFSKSLPRNAGEGTGFRCVQREKQGWLLI